MGNKLEDIVDKICAYHSDHDTRDFYRKVRLCLAECLLLLDFSLLMKDEIYIIHHSKEIIDKNDIAEIKKIYFYISSRWSPKEKENKERNNALRAIMSIFVTFDDYGEDECYRPETLEFIVGYLLQAGVKADKIYSVLNNKFVSILSYTKKS